MTAGRSGRTAGSTRMRTAPALVVCFSDRDAYLDRYAEPDKGWTDRDEARWPVPYWHVDTGMAAMILLLAAQDAGLAACFFGVPPERWPALFEAFDVPARLAPVGVVSLGYPAAGRALALAAPRPAQRSTTCVSYGSFARSTRAGAGAGRRARVASCGAITATIRSRSSIEANSTVIRPLRRPSSTRTRVS